VPHSRADIHTAACGGFHARADGYFLTELQPIGLTPRWSSGKA